MKFQSVSSLASFLLHQSGSNLYLLEATPTREYNYITLGVEEGLGWLTLAR